MDTTLEHGEVVLLEQGAARGAPGLEAVVAEDLVEGLVAVAVAVTGIGPARGALATKRGALKGGALATTRGATGGALVIKSMEPATTRHGLLTTVIPCSLSRMIAGAQQTLVQRT